jgi:hypothetical protein
MRHGKTLHSLLLLLVLGDLLHSAVARAQARCPWLNVATASGVLEGPALLAMPKSTENETECVFRFEKENTAYTLQIAVNKLSAGSKSTTLDTSDCSSPGTPLRAIGNEALLCADDHKHSSGEEVVGRVRDTHFRVVITTSAHNDSSMTRDVLEMKTRSVAEAVAGSLF